MGATSPLLAKSLERDWGALEPKESLQTGVQAPPFSATETEAQGRDGTQRDGLFRTIDLPRTGWWSEMIRSLRGQMNLEPREAEGGGWRVWEPGL